MNPNRARNSCEMAEERMMEREVCELWGAASAGGELHSGIVADDVGLESAYLSGFTDARIRLGAKHQATIPAYVGPFDAHAPTATATNSATAASSDDHGDKLEG